MQDVSMQDDSLIAKSDEEIKSMLEKELSPEQENKKKERNEFYNNIMPHRQSLKNPLNEQLQFMILKFKQYMSESQAQAFFNSK